MAKTKSPKKLIVYLLVLTLVVGSIFGPTTTAFAQETGVTTAAEETAQLQILVAEAEAVDLSSYEAPYSQQVAYATARAQNLLNTSSATAQELYIARLTLQVALDTLIVDVQEANVEQLQGLIKDGTLTYVKLTQMYLTRIELYDFNTVAINSVRSLNPYALEQAAACDAAFAADHSVATGIFGMTVMLKDNIGTIGSDGMPTTAGSVALADNYAPYDATQVAFIKEAGGIILGKLNLAEFANWTANGSVSSANRALYESVYGVPYTYSGSSPNGYSSLGGQVLNPYKVDLAANGSPILNPSGSSSGSGANAAAGLSAMTIGSETNGSILSPATSNSIVGIKPTVGLVSRYGVIPLSSSQDTTGPMTRNVTDAAALLTAMAGADPEHDTAANSYNVAPTFGIDYTQYLDPNALQGVRLGITATSNSNTAAYQESIALLRSLGATVVPASGSISVSSSQSYQVLNYDFKKDMLEYLSDKTSAMKSLADIIDYYWTHPETAPRYGFHNLINADLLDLSSDSADTATYEADVARTIAGARTNIDAALTDYNLDALISFGGTSGAGAIAGYPSITVPAGYQDRAHDATNWGAINLCFTGTAFSEADLIAMAYAYEQARDARVAPGMAVKTELRDLISSVGVMADYVQANVVDELAAAREIVASNFATQMELDQAGAALTAAINSARPASMVLLNAAITYAQAQDVEFLNDAVAELFNEALASALAMSQNTGATQSQVDAAYEALMEAIHLFSFTANPTTLQYLVDYANTIFANINDYLTAGKAEFLTALTGAETILADETSLDADFEAAATALNSALMELRLIPDRTLLGQLLSKGYSLDTSVFTPDSVTTFMGMMMFAQGIYDDVEATKVEVDTATVELENALSGLQKLPTNNPTGPTETVPQPTPIIINTGGSTRVPSPIYTIMPAFGSIATGEEDTQYRIDPSVDIESAPAPDTAADSDAANSAATNTAIEDVATPLASAPVTQEPAAEALYWPFVVAIAALAGALLFVLIKTRRRQQDN